MGGGSEKKKTNAMLDSQNAQAQTEHNNYMNTVNTGLSGATGRASDMYSSLSGGYNAFASGQGNYDPTKYGSLATGGGGGGGGGVGGALATANADPRFGEAQASYENFMNGGGVNTAAFNAFQGNLSDIAKTGGWTPEGTASVNQDIAGFKNIAQTGGVDQAGQDRIRGGGVFDEFAKTGGYSPQDIANIRTRATSVIPSYYDTAKTEAGRMAAVQGGYGPGQAALFARMGRDQSKSAADASLAAETGIKSAVNQGRQWGGTQMSTAEQGLQGLMSSNRLAGLTGASSTEANMLNSIAQNRTGAANAGAGNETGMQSVIQQGKEFGTSGINTMAENARQAALQAASISASSGAASAAQTAAQREWQAQFDREGQQYGLEGLSSLYGSKPGEVNMYLDASNTGQQTANTVGGRIVDQRMQNNPSMMSQIMPMVGQIAGGAAGLATGAGALGYGRKAPNQGLYFQTPTTH